MVAPSPYPFGLRNAAAYASAHAEPSGRHRRFALDFSTAASTHTHTDSSEEVETWAGADFSELRDLEAMHRFLAASDYCFGYSNSDDEVTYDPTRECFHIGLRMPGTSNEHEGPYIVAQVLKPRTYKLANERGEIFTNAWNIE